MAITGSVIDYEVSAGDTLGSISARLGAGVVAIVARNGIRRQDPLRAGQVLTIDNRHIASIEPGRRLAINIPQRMLFLVDGDAVWGLPIAVGLRSWPTPVGGFTVIDKEENPTWDVPLSIQEEMRAQGKPVITSMPPSPQNPLGAHWVRLSFSSIGIHGTIAPSSIYNYASHGCIRMHPEDVAFLFARVELDTVGAITYRPLMIASIDGRVFAEVHPDGYKRAPFGVDYLRAIAAREGFGERVNWDAVADVVRLQHGLAVDVTKDD